MNRILALVLILTQSSIMQDLRITYQPKQMEARRVVQDEGIPYEFYGGAKGGGKSKYTRNIEMERRLRYAGTSGVIIRKTFPELMSNHVRKFWTEFPFTYDWYNKSEKTIYYPNGSVTDFRYLKKTTDVYNYQGIEYDDISMDEATQHEEEVFKILKTSLRQAPEIIDRYPDFRPSFRLTGNPGGIGHAWVKRIFVDRDFKQGEHPEDYRFIQARVDDNPIFLRANPQYKRNLEDLPEELRKAYLEGDWNIFAGQYFKKLRREKHLVPPIRIPDDWMHWRSLDWGYGHPSVVLWWAANPNTGDIFIYRYYKEKEVVASKMARRVAELTNSDENILTTVAGHDCWAKITSDDTRTERTLADIINNNGLPIEKAIIDRISGWMNLRELLEWDEKRKAPQLKIFDTCEEVYTDLACLVHDEKHPEDVLKMDGDDTGDSARYGGMYYSEARKEGHQMTEIEQYINEITSDKEDWDTY